MQQYFDTLPTNVQETIKQSGIALHNEQEMKTARKTSCITKEHKGPVIRTGLCYFGLFLFEGVFSGAAQRTRKIVRNVLPLSAGSNPLIGRASASS